MLRRALHTVECRELGPEAAQQQFGPFADTVEGVTVFLDEDDVRARHPGHEELHQLARAVRERGPAVDVALVAPTPSVMLLDEMSHVVGKAAEPVQGAAGRLYEPRRPLRPVRWHPSAARAAADDRELWGGRPQRRASPQRNPNPRLSQGRRAPIRGEGA